jgi:hypothetical protein
MNPLEIQKVQITSTPATIELENDGQDWVLVEGLRRFPARDDRIDTFLNELTGSRLVRKVTANDTLWGDFGLARDAPLTVTVQSGPASAARTVTAVWGDESSEPGLAYVRLVGDSTVYASDGRVSFYLEQPATYWSYLRVFPEDLRASETIAVSGTVSTRFADDEIWEADLAWQRNNDQWTSASGELLNGEEVDRLLRELSDLVGRDFHRRSPAGYEAVGSIAADYSDGRTFAVELLDSGDGLVARASGQALPGDPFGGLYYEIPEATVRRLFPQEDPLSER